MVSLLESPPWSSSTVSAPRSPRSSTHVGCPSIAMRSPITFPDLQHGGAVDAVVGEVTDRGVGLLKS